MHFFLILFYPIMDKNNFRYKINNNQAKQNLKNVNQLVL